MTEKYIYGSGL